MNYKVFILGVSILVLMNVLGTVLGTMYANSHKAPFVPVEVHYPDPKNTPGLKCNYMNCKTTDKEERLGCVQEFSCVSGISRQFVYCRKHFNEFYPQYSKYSEFEFENEVFVVALNPDLCNEEE